MKIAKKHEKKGIYYNTHTLTSKVSRKGEKRATCYVGTFAIFDRNARKWKIEQKRALTKNDATDWIEGKVREHEQKGTRIMLAGNSSFASFAEIYKSEYLEAKDLSTLNEEIKKVDLLSEYFGDEPLDEIDMTRILEFKKWFLNGTFTRKRKTKDGLVTVEYKRTPATAHRYLARLRNLLTYAANLDKIKSVPAFQLAIKMEQESPKTSTISDAEFMRMLEACEMHGRQRWRLVLIAAYTLGCRAGELYNIRRGDITSLDQERRVGVIEIRKNKTGARRSQTKKVVITSWLYDEMERQKAFDKPADERLFMWTREYRRVFDSLKTAAGIDSDATFHTLRAASATNRETSGQDFDALQAELGHAKGSKVTRQHYIRPSDSQAIEKALTYNDYLERLRQRDAHQADDSNFVN